MHNFKHTLCLLLTASLWTAFCHAAGDKPDLQKLADRYNQVASGKDERKTFAALDTYLRESARQKDATHEIQARTYRLYAFYNRGMKDSLYHYLPQDLGFIAAQGNWPFYYSCRSLKVEALLRDNKVQTALDEARKMYAKAREDKQENGQGISAYLIALSYQCMNRDKQAVGFFREAERLLRKENNTGQLHNLYATAWQSLAVEGRYDELLAMNDRWEAMWDTYCRANNVEPGGLANYYIVCHLSRAHAYREKGDLKKAHAYLEKGRVCAEALYDISNTLYLQEMALYQKQCGNYAKALELADKRYEIQQSLNNRMGCINALELRAELLARLARPQEAVALYQQLLAVKDSLRRLDMAAQLDEVRSLYDVDRLTLKQQTTQNRLYVVVWCAMLLMAGILLYIRYAYRLRRKNRVLYTKLKQLQAAEDAMFRTQNLTPEAELDKDEKLWRGLCEVMQSEKLFTRQTGRKELAERLHTNTTYVADVIRQFSDGMTVSEFVNRYRLRYAGKLLSERPDLSVDATAEEAGFTSRSTYYRLFRDYYGMSPNEYRATARHRNG